MLFNSFVFLVFAALFFIGWFFLRGKRKVRWMFLIAASLFFYGWWDWRYIFLLLYTGMIDFSAGIAMERYPSRKKLLLGLSLCGNVGSLAIFKYLGFATVSANFLMHTLGMGHQFPVYNLLLPVGISFYTFESLSYTIDVYKDRVKPTHNVLQFFSFLALFPHLVAGPIIRPYDLLPQIEADKQSTEQQRWDGLSLIARGFFKKMVIADNLAAPVNAAFAAAIPQHSAPYWWAIVTMFAFQIYCDFSGYTDIARGLAKWMGYEFPLNFNHPYIADSIRDFWSRWHISLSSWFRDYVYIPLGGSKKGNFRSHVNMWITMVVSGLWHGAAWHFVIWGALHAFYLTLERITLWPKRVSTMIGGKLVGSAILLTMVWVAWVFFRAPTAGMAARIVAIMFSPGASDWSPVINLDKMAMAAVCVAALRESYLWMGLDRVRIWQTGFARALQPAMVSLIFVASIFWRGPGAAFIYFQF